MGRTQTHAAGGGLTQSAEAAREAGLTYASDIEPGIKRARKGKGFIYIDPDGRVVRDRDSLDRIRSLAIPPAWEHVWITMRPRGHLQVTGRDARRMLGFARALPRIRRRVTGDMRRKGLPREKIVATILKLLETTFVRIGNEE